MATPHCGHKWQMPSFSVGLLVLHLKQHLFARSVRIDSMFQRLLDSFIYSLSDILLNCSFTCKPSSSHSTFDAVLNLLTHSPYWCACIICIRCIELICTLGRSGRLKRENWFITFLKRTALKHRISLPWLQIRQGTSWSLQHVMVSQAKNF